MCTRQKVSINFTSGEVGRKPRLYGDVHPIVSINFTSGEVGSLPRVNDSARYDVSINFTSGEVGSCCDYNFYHYHHLCFHKFHFGGSGKKCTRTYSMSH